jgi:SAM-dependent methyltransferase
MNRERFSFIAHTEHDLCNPIGDEKTNRVISYMGLTPDHRVVDVGSGKGEWAFRIIAAHGCTVTAIESAPSFAAESLRRAVARKLDHRFELESCRAEDYFNSDPPRRFDAALCIGSSHAFRNLKSTLAALRAHVAPGGPVLIGEGYWRKPPCHEYLASFGGTEDELTTHDGNVRVMMEAGFTPTYACTATTDEFDHYEWRYSRGIEHFVRDNPADPDAHAMLDKSRKWRDGYLKWGRETMGFGLYVLENRSP